MTEVKRDLNKYFKSTSIQIVNTWKRRGNVEPYFKHQYQDFNYKIGTLTEYFQFGATEHIQEVLRDLQQL